MDRRFRPRQGAEGDPGDDGQIHWHGAVRHQERQRLPSPDQHDLHVQGDRATAWSRIVYMVRNKDDKPSPAMGGHYDDTLIKEDGHWKFLQRVVMMEIPFQDPREIKGEPPPAPL